MRVEVISTGVQHGPLAKYIVKYPGHRSLDSSCWFPVTCPPELIADLLNDTLLEALDKCEED